jgi:hypothetical protein
VWVSVSCTAPPSDNAASTSPANGTSEQAPRYLDYMFASPCIPFSPTESIADAPDCGIARLCPDPAARAWDSYGLASATQRWEYINTRCYSKPPTAADLPKPQVTPGLVLTALRRMGLPALQAHTQPAGKTLVNFDTIFYTEPQPFTRTVRLLGQRVDVEATPSQYTWHHGDGTTASTTSPGAPYPSKEITYDYTHAHTTVGPSVDVTYTARFRVRGGAWQQIPESVSIAGPAGSLRISEATAVLSGLYE